MIIPIISIGLGILGVYGFFSGNIIFIMIGGIYGFIENLIGIFSGQQKSLSTAIIACIIGSIYAISKGLPIWFGILIGLCFETTIVGLIGLSMFVFMYYTYNKFKS